MNNGSELILKTTNTAGKVGSKANALAAVASSSKDLFDAWVSYKKVHEVEKTKRESIKAQRDVAITKIKAQKDILEQYLIQSFSERKFVIEETFKRLDSALESDNLDLASQAMQSIVSIVKESPLKQVNELVAMTNDPNIDEIEI